MRPSNLALGTFLALVSTASAYAEWSPPGPYTFTQGQTYDLYFEQPAVGHFLAADLAVQYSPLVYEPIALLPGSLDTLLSVLASLPFPVSGSLNQVDIQISPAPSAALGQYGLSLPAGSMFGVRFQVKADAPLGPGAGAVPVDVSFAFGDPLELDPFLEVVVPATVSVGAAIVPVPEPATWATMLAGLVLLGGAAARLRRNVPGVGV